MSNYFSYSSFKDKSIAEIIIGGIVTLILLIIFIPLLGFWLSYFMGWVASKLVGDEIIKALSIFGLQISKDAIPWIAGLLGWIATFFKQVKVSNN